MKKHLQKAELNDRPLKMAYCHDLVVIGERAGDVRRREDRLQTAQYLVYQMCI